MSIDPEQIRLAKKLLMERVSMEPGADTGCVVRFEAPDRDALIAGGVPAEVADRIVGAAWYQEMVEAVVETPEFCDPGDPPEVVLGFARDAIEEYISKRF